MEANLEHLDVGNGSHHWRATCSGQRFFVTVDDLDHKHYLGPDPDTVFARLLHALETAFRLRRGGMDFVVAPLRAADGEVVHRLGRRYAVAIYPYLGDPRPFRKTLNEDERAAYVDMLARLHGASRSMAPPADVVPVAVPFREKLERALVSTLPSDDSSTIRAWLRRFDALAEDAGQPEMVVTHGEPHSGNIVRTGGGFALVDWDTAGVAPRERDLWLIGGGDPRLCELYRLRWRLDDTAWAVSTLLSAEAAEDHALARQVLRDSLDHEPFTRD